MDSGNSLFFALTLQAFLILISATFTNAEISLLTVNRNKLESLLQKGDKKAKRLVSLTSEPAKFLATIQVGNTLAGFLGSAFAADNFSSKLTEFFLSTGINLPYQTLNNISVVSIILVLAYFSMVFAELVPKRVAMKKANTLAFFYSGPVLFVSKLFTPVVLFLTKSTNFMLRLFRIDPKELDAEITEEEIRLMIDLSSAGGSIKSGEKEILHNVFEFDNKTAGEVMTHRKDVSFLYLQDNDEEWEKIITEKRHAYYPVCGKGPDDISGLLDARDYLVLKDRSRETVLAQALRPARFIPLSVRTDNLFRQMKKSRNHFNVVVDEHGSMMGIVTMNDLLELLVGDLEDDSSAPIEKPVIESAGEDRWYVKGSAPLDKVSRELGISLPVEKYDTFTGLVFSLLGHVPEDGQNTVEEAREVEVLDLGVPFKLTIKILEVLDHRLEKALVKKVPL